MSGALSSISRFRPVVAVDDATVEVVEVGGGETAAVERHQRPQLRRDHRHHGQDHPLRPVLRVDERLDHLEALAELLGLELGGRFRDLLAQLVADLGQVHAREQLADGLRADAGRERILAVLLDGLVVLLLVQQLLLGERRHAGLGDDVVLEVEHALEVLERHVEQQADAGGQRLQEPDVRDRGGELDVAHALAAHLGQRHLDAALLADQALVLHALVLAAQALVILDRSEDAGAEEAIALRLEGAVVDRLRLLDLAERPGSDVVRAGDRDANLVEGRRLHLLLEKVGDLVHRLSLSGRNAGGPLRPFDCIGRHPLSPHGWGEGESHSAAAGGSRGRSTAGSFAASSAAVAASELTSSTLRPSARISFTSTLKLSGIPASNASSPRTIAS